ncbi:hypothetical protein ABZ649_04585 [Streptomyces albidoflavus]|uniref:hypothetical protein n=1 Tax=Streptomyces albidoflavus TaxID=1886 RepID=UPI0033CA9692
MRTLFRAICDERELRQPAAFQSAFRKAARELAEEQNDPTLLSCCPADTTLEAWYYGTRKPQRDARRVITHMFGLSIDRLWGPASVPARDVEYRDGPGHSVTELKRGAEMAARRARDFALGAERGQLGDETLGFLQDEVARITAIYQRVPLPEIFPDLHAAQEDCFRLIEGGRVRPTQMRQLHVCAGLLSWLMAKASHDLGDLHSAMMQARTAGVCAQQAEHDALLAAVDGLKSLITYWAGRPEDAVFFARKGAAEHPNLRGTVSAWLPALEARAAALLGDGDSALTANARAIDARTRVVADDLDNLGGILTFPEAKHDYYTAESRVLLGLHDQETAERADAAAAAYHDRSTDHWAFGDEAGSQCNVAIVRLNGGVIDGAAEAIRPVLDLPNSQRNNGIVVSARRVASALAQSPARNSVLGRELGGEISLFSTTRLALPS